MSTTVQDFVEGLKCFERDYITQERVRDFMDAHHSLPIRLSRTPISAATTTPATSSIVMIYSK